MIFGNKKDFAIEALIEADLVAPSNPWGRLCVWIDGHTIGDFNDHYCALYPAYDGFLKANESLSNLWIDHFVGMSDECIWNFLDGLLYGYHGNIEIEDNRSLKDSQNDWERFGQFDFLTNWGEMFDQDGKSFIIKIPDGELKILNFDYESEKVNSYLCSEFFFRQAVKLFTAWYEEQEKLLECEQ